MSRLIRPDADAILRDHEERIRALERASVQYLSVPPYDWTADWGSFITSFDPWTAQNHGDPLTTTKLFVSTGPFGSDPIPITFDVDGFVFTFNVGGTWQIALSGGIEDTYTPPFKYDEISLFFGPPPDGTPADVELDVTLATNGAGFASTTGSVAIAAGDQKCITWAVFNRAGGVTVPTDWYPGFRVDANWLGP